MNFEMAAAQDMARTMRAAMKKASFAASIPSVDRTIAAVPSAEVEDSAAPSNKSFHENWGGGLSDPLRNPSLFFYTSVEHLNKDFSKHNKLSALGISAALLSAVIKRSKTTTITATLRA